MHRPMRDDDFEATKQLAQASLSVTYEGWLEARLQEAQERSERLEAELLAVAHTLLEEAV